MRPEEALGGFAALTTVLGFVAALMVLSILPFWLAFKKLRYPGWWALIPLFNTFKLAEAAGRPGIWGLVGLLAFIPFIGWLAAIIVWIVLMMDVARSFGKDEIWTLLLTFLPWIGFLILGAGASEYRGPAGPEPHRYRPVNV